MNTRPAALAGAFYPADVDALAHSVDAMLGAGAAVGDTPKVLILPHAGHIYSGAIAAKGVALLDPGLRRVVMLGPNHRVPLRVIASVSARYFATPLGEVPVARLQAEGWIRVHDEAHRLEHCLEVQLPLLQRRLRQFEIVPLLVGEVAPGIVADVLDALWGGPETLILVSSDLSHFLDYASACQRDQATCGAILAQQARIGPEQACGCHALNGVNTVLARVGLPLRLLAYANSGDTAGDKRRVVGYASFAA